MLVGPSASLSITAKYVIAEFIRPISDCRLPAFLGKFTGKFGIEIACFVVRSPPNCAYRFRC